MAFRRRKSYPIFSQEFVIHNHADIGFFFVLCVLIGLMFEVTAKTAFIFILPQYNSSLQSLGTEKQKWIELARSIASQTPVTPDGSHYNGEIVYYHYGAKDLVTILFYVIIAIILHAIVQEYILDKINRRLHLSKVKQSRFNESGQLAAFHLASMLWSLYVAATEGYLSSPKTLWESYPHVYLPFQVKFFYLCQLAYWLHALPELYFQKVKKEEIPRQLQYIVLYLLHIGGAYLLNLTRLGLILLLLQSVAEFLFHIARLFYFTDENNQKLFNAWAVVFVVTRLFTLTLSVLTIGFGLARAEIHTFNPDKGNFNTLLFRMIVLLMMCVSQTWMMWRFIHFQLRRWRECCKEQAAKKRMPVAVMAKQQVKILKRDSGYHENGLIKAENGSTPRPKKIKSP